MKVMKWLLAAALILLLSGCDRQEAVTRDEYIQPFTFYYRAAETAYSGSEGLIRPEIRELGSKSYTDDELFRLYLSGPISEELTLSVPKGMELLRVSRSGSVLHLHFRQSADVLSAVDQSIAFACLTKTALQLEGITRIRFRMESKGGQLLQDILLSENDILLYDSGEVPAGTELTLYYADATGKYLLPEKRTLPPLPQDRQPQYVLEQLLSGPVTAGLISPLPQGAAVLDINTDLGLCSVDFNADFYNNRPSNEREEQLILYSIVNSLCELDYVNQVQIYVEGNRLDTYVCMDLSEPYSIDTSVAAPIREDINEFEAMLCLPGDSDGLLHRLPVRIRTKTGASREEVLLQTLFARDNLNGLDNPAFGLPMPASVTVAAQICSLEYSGASLDDSGKEAVRQALPCITASLCCLQGISAVQVRVDGVPLTDGPLHVEQSWYCMPDGQ